MDIKKIINMKEVDDPFLKAQDSYTNGDLESAKLFFSEVNRKSIGNYVLSQFILAEINNRQGNREVALEHLKNIPSVDNMFYGLAQLKSYYISKNSKYLLNLTDKNIGSFDRAQFELGLIEFKEVKPSVSKIYDYWKNISKDSAMFQIESYRINLIEKICDLCSDKMQSYFDVFQGVEKIISNLNVINSDEKFENNIAHYTNITVSKLLLSKDEKSEVFTQRSPLRLNTINLMNDPKEGLLINELLNFDGKIQTQDVAFISCFTLHHDSLNQFRLYGKEENKEASGLSLVLSKEFFSQDPNLTYMMNYREGTDGEFDSKEIDSKRGKLSLMPLYRCIYLDPTSGLIKVAQREEWSLHRAYRNKNKEHILEMNPEAEEHWQEYQKDISTIESEVTKDLKELVTLVKGLNQEDLSSDEKELLAEILLPLRYLIKHMAFREEQECRMIYVTQMDNPLIQYDEKINRIYIDYEPSVMEHLEKIYLAPKAKDEKIVFEYLCSRGQEVRKGKESVKVKISQNPFR